jgi:phosphopentomutase
LTERERQLNELLESLPHVWPDNALDVFTMEAARSALRRRRPRLLYVGLGETDEWGHARRYDLYLDAAHNSDRWLGRTWRALQEDPQYRGKTTLVVTINHGRGATRADWTDHGKDVAGAEFVWVAVPGPDTPALGERQKVEVTQGQLAATIARLLGEDFHAAQPKAAGPLPVFVERRLAP